MYDCITTETNVTIGIDMGDRYSFFCELSDDGEIIEEGRIANTRDALKKRFERIPPARIVMEVGSQSPWISKLLSSFGHEVIVANPRKLRLIYHNESKSDKVDAEYLARIGRLDPKLLSPIQHRSLDTIVDLNVIRNRDLLVRSRSRMIMHVRSVIKALGGRVPKCQANIFAERARLRIPPELQETLLPMLDLIETLNIQIEERERRIEELANNKYPETELLTQVPGVGVVTALAFILTIEDPYRFKSSRAIGSYLGLRPKTKESGDRQPQLGITKTGSVLMRKLLVQSAHVILQDRNPDSDLKRWGQAIAERGGKNATKRAAVAVARKLAVLLHRLWLNGEVYEPFRNSEQVAQAVN
jgi:transposase